MEYIVSQYSVIEDVITTTILRPDGSWLAFNLTFHPSIAYAVADELNSLLIIPSDHDTHIYHELPIIPVCNMCNEKKDSTRFQGRYIGYECTDCMPF